MISTLLFRYYTLAIIQINLYYLFSIARGINYYLNILLSCHYSCSCYYLWF